MDIETFLLERNQTLYENSVEINLTESGVHPYRLNDLLGTAQIAELAELPLGYGYTDGRPALRAAVAQWYDGASAGNVAITHGTSEANLLAIFSLLAPGDEIIVLLPNFMQIPGLATAMGMRATPFLLREEDGWQPRLDRLAQAIGPRTRMIALANPNNPTGAVASAETMSGLLRLANENGLFVLCDEIYRGAEIDQPETPSFYGLGEKVVVTMSLSKSFALPGLRLGWIVGAEQVVERVVRWQDYSSIGTGMLNQVIAEKVMQPDLRETVLGRSREILSANARLLESWLADRNDLFSWRRTQAGGMAFLRYNLPMTSERFSAELREQESVFVVAGHWFGLDGYIRLGIGVGPDQLREGLARIDRFVRQCRAKL